MIVIAIIVILSGATVIGVVSWLRNAQNTQAKLEAENGDNFEAAAYDKVNKIAGTAGSHVVQQTNLDTPAPTQAVNNGNNDNNNNNNNNNNNDNNNNDNNNNNNNNNDNNNNNNNNNDNNNNNNNNNDSGNNGNSGSGDVATNGSGSYTYWNDNGGQLTVDINQQGIKDDNVVTFVFKVNNGTIKNVNNLGNYNPSFSYSGSTVTVTIKKSDCPEWMRNNWNGGNFGSNIQPQFEITGGTKTEVTLVSATSSK